MKSETKYIGIVGLMLVVVVALLVVSTIDLPNPDPNPDSTPFISNDLKQFSSLAEIKDFVKSNTKSYGYGYGYGMMEKASIGGVTATMDAAGAATAESQRASDYSETNIQVQGVDEPDIVKNDGKYIYTVTGNKVVIVDAYPAEKMEIVSEIELDEGVRNIFVNEDKMVVFTTGSDYVSGIPCADVYEAFVPCGGHYKQTTVVSVYDILDREEPELETEVELDGYYVEARMIDEYVYVISSKYVQMNHFDLPSYEVNGVKKNVLATDIGYFDYPSSSYSFNSVSAINLDDGDVDTKVYMMDRSSNIFVSQNNVYLTYMKRLNPDYQLEKMVEEVYLPILPSEEDEKITDILNSDKQSYEKSRDIQEVLMKYVESLEGDELESFSEEFEELLEEHYAKIQKETEKTVVHKIEIDGNDIDYRAEGEVPGNVLNQFSMDEHDGYFRIATTTGHVSRSGGATSLNHLYVLDDSLEIIGSVEDLAKGERIYSARFMGDRAYIVTFKKVDPLFVIDLSDPDDPEVLGYLKITGYSDYLHPYDEDHVIGIGKETRGGNEHFSWYQGIKISLFDVSDVNNPIEKAKIEIGDRGTESYALQDHKAVLFDKEKELLVIPVALSEVDESQYGGGEVPDNAHGRRTWQGAYVLDIDLDGIEVRGRVTHYGENDTLDSWYRGGQKEIQRSLYMDDVLYTISQSMVKANWLDNVEEISSVELPVEIRDEPVYRIAA